MIAFQPGDVVLALFPGAQMTKPRPTIVVSTAPYNSTRPDLVLAILTTQVPQALMPFDY